MGAIPYIGKQLIMVFNTFLERKIISKLPSDERSLVVALFYNMDTLKNYAEKTGMCYPTALRKKKRVLEKLGKKNFALFCNGFRL